MKSRNKLKIEHLNLRGRGNGRRRRGSVIVLVALAMVSLCGFAALSTDYGRIVWTKNQLQRACDAAAIAGASQLPNSQTAQSTAQTTAGQNDLSAPTFSWPNGVRQIRVSGSQQVTFGFAKVIGLTSGTVTASATAGRIPLLGVNHNVPLAITTTDYYSYKSGSSFELSLIDNNRQDFRASTVTALDLHPDDSGKSGSVFQNDLTYGYDGTTYLNQQINNALNSSLSSQGPNLMQAMTDRINRAAASPYFDTGSNYTFPNYPPRDPRVFTLIVADPNPTNNNNPKVTARLLIPVYLETARSPGNSNNYFIRMRILPGKLYNSDDPNVVAGDDSTPDGGLAVVKLLQ